MRSLDVYESITALGSKLSGPWYFLSLTRAVNELYRVNWYDFGKKVQESIGNAWW